MDFQLCLCVFVCVSSCGSIVGVMNQSWRLREQLFLLMDPGTVPEELYSTASHRKKNKKNPVIFTHINPQSASLYIKQTT